MVAILIFALGILGLVAMGGTAVTTQSDAQYRTEASSLADAIAGADRARRRPHQRRDAADLAQRSTPADVTPAI